MFCPSHGLQLMLIDRHANMQSITKKLQLHLNSNLNALILIQYTSHIAWSLDSSFLQNQRKFSKVPKLAKQSLYT